jgi:hypothetical protein
MGNHTGTWVLLFSYLGSLASADDLSKCFISFHSRENIIKDQNFYPFESKIMNPVRTQVRHFKKAYLFYCYMFEIIFLIFFWYTHDLYSVCCQFIKYKRICTFEINFWLFWEYFVYVWGVFWLDCDQYYLIMRIWSSNIFLTNIFKNLLFF